jgi:hypothetical protein
VLLLACFVTVVSPLFSLLGSIEFPDCRVSLALTRDEARRIAVNVAKLLELLCRRQT